MAWIQYYQPFVKSTGHKMQSMLTSYIVKLLWRVELKNVAKIDNRFYTMDVDVGIKDKSEPSSKQSFEDSGPGVHSVVRVDHLGHVGVGLPVGSGQGRFDVDSA